MKGQTIKRKDSNVPGLLLEFEGYDRGWPSCCASLTAGAGTRCMSLLSSSPNLLTKSKDSCSYLLSFCYGSRLKESSVISLSLNERAVEKQKIKTKNENRKSNPVK